MPILHQKKKQVSAILDNPYQAERDLQGQKEQKQRKQKKTQKSKPPKEVRHAQRIVGWEDMWAECLHIANMFLFLFGVYMAYQLTHDPKGKDPNISNLFDTEVLRQIGWGLWIVCGSILVSLFFYAINTYWFDHVKSRLSPEWQTKIKRKTDFDGTAALFSLTMIIPLALLLWFGIQNQMDNVRAVFWILVILWSICIILSVVRIYQETHHKNSGE